MTTQDDYRIRKGHKRGCRACAAVKMGDWSHPWGVHVNTTFLDKLGRCNNNGFTMWEEYSCNDSDCSAKLLVKADAFLASAPIGFNR